MTIPTLLNTLASYLRPLVESNNGVWALSETVEDTLALLTQAPNKWRCVLQWQRSEALGETATVANVRFMLVIQQSKGLPATPLAGDATSRAGNPPLLERADQVIAWVRQIRIASTETDRRGPYFSSAYWITDPTIPSRQLAAEFTLTMSLDAVQPQAVPVVLPEELSS